MFEFLGLCVVAVLFVLAVLPRIAGATIYDYDADGPLTQFVWSDLTTMQLYNRNFWHVNKFGEPMKAGDFDPFKAEGSPIAYVDDLAAGEKGDKVRFPYLGHLVTGNDDSTTAMVFGDNTMEGNEEDIRTGDLDVSVAQVRGATGFIGRVTALRNKLYRTPTIKRLLSTLAVDWLEDDVFYALYNGSSQHLISLSVTSYSAHPNTYYARRSLTDPTQLQESDTMSADLLDFVIARFQYRSKPMPFANVGGMNGIIGIISPEQEMSLKNDERFWNLHKDAIARERDARKGNMHPLFSNAGYKYGPIYLYVTSRVFTGNRLSTVGNHDETMHGALFMGARAVMCAHAGVPADAMPEEAGMSYDKDGNVKFYFNVSDDRDYGNKNKQAIAFVYGYMRAQFTERQSADNSAEIATSVKYCDSSLIMWTKEATATYA